MIYFDLCTKSSQWFKPGIPRELFTINTDIEPSQDWIRLDCLDCKGKSNLLIHLAFNMFCTIQTEVCLNSHEYFILV